jgi:hypothetical protein
MRDDIVMRRSPKVRIREDRDGVHIVMDMELRSFSYLNRTAGFVLKAFDGKRTLREIKDMLKALYPKAADQVDADVDKIVEKFVMEGYTYIDDPVVTLPEDTTGTAREHTNRNDSKE